MRIYKREMQSARRVLTIILWQFSSYSEKSFWSTCHRQLVASVTSTSMCLPCFSFPTSYMYHSLWSGSVKHIRATKRLLSLLAVGNGFAGECGSSKIVLWHGQQIATIIGSMCLVTDNSCRQKSDTCFTWPLLPADQGRRHASPGNHHQSLLFLQQQSNTNSAS